MCPPSHTISWTCFRYYVSFVDAYSRYTWIYFLKLKYEVSHFFNIQTSWWNSIFNRKIKALQTDWDGDFRSLATILRTNDITNRVYCLYTSKQNGVIERKHRHIIETGLTLSANAFLPLYFWDDSFLTVVFFF